MSETFTWGSGGEKLTPSDRRRRIAEAMLAKGSDASPVQHWTQGAARVVQALMGGMQMRDADAADKAGQASVAADAASLAPSAPSSAAPFAPASGSTVAAPNVTPDIKNGIVQTAQAIGADPVDLATAISYETGGTFDPTKAGPRTQWGQHRGLIQFGEPQAKQHGVDWSNPVGSQLGPNGAVASYLKSSGFKPGMNFLDLYSTINAGAPGLYNRSDAKNGGAPGTVRDKVEQQMQGHRAKAQALLSAQAQADMPAPDAMQAEAPTGQPGFAIPQGARPVESIPGDDPAKLRAEAQAYAQTNPEAARQMLARADAAEASMAPAPMPPARPADLAMAPPAAPGMTAETFAQIQGGKPLEPVFQSEGASQPWMGTAIPPQQPPMVAQAAPTTLPPPRPADLPAPGAVEASGQMPPLAAPQPQMTPDLSNSPDGGMRALQVQAEQARQSQPAAPQEAASPFARVAQALGIQSQPQATAAAPSPAVARVAEAVGAAPSAAAPAAPSPAIDRVATAMRVLNSPYAQPGQKAMATMIVQQAFKDPTEAEAKKLDLEIKRKSLTKSDDPTPIQEYNLAVKQGETRSYTDWKTAQTKAGATSVNVNGGGSDKQIFDTVKESSDAARSAATGLNAVREARAAVKGGAFLGAGADTKLAFQKIGASLGLANADKIINTETFRSAIAPAVASLLKSTVGSANISNSDREFAEKAAGGSISLDEGTITRLLDIMERGNVTILEGHQKRMDAIYPDDVANKRERALFGVPMPAAPAAPPAAAAPDRAALEAEARRRGLLK